MDVAWSLLVLAALLGWGGVGCWVLRTRAELDLRSFADRLGLGIAVVVTIMGFALAVDLFHIVAPLLVALGAVFGAAQAVLYAREVREQPKGPLLIAMGVGAVLLGLVWVYAAARSANFRFQNTDDPNYIYLALRMIKRGELLDPSNIRRLTSLGGMSGLQSLYLLQLPNRFVPFTDFFLGSLLILTTLWRTRQRTWSIFGIAAALIAVGFPLIYGLNFNTSPVLLPAGLILYTLVLLHRLRVDDLAVRATLGLTAAIGLVAATTMTVRPQFGMPLIPIVLVVALWPPFGRILWYRLAGFAGGWALCILGWAVASWRAVGTPLFPLMNGNTNPTFPALGVRTVPFSVGGVLSRVWEALSSPLWLVAGAIGLGVIVANYWFRKTERPYYRAALLVTAAAFGLSLVWLAALTFAWWNFGPLVGAEYIRYWNPLFLAVILLPIVLLNASPAPRDRNSLLSVLAAFMAIALLAGLAPDGVGTNLTAASDAITSQSLFTALDSDPYGGLAGTYDQVAQWLPPGAKVFSAVDDPYRLLDRDIELHTLDVVGWASPSPKLPFFAGDQAKTDWLKANGYTHVIANRPNTSRGLYNDRAWKQLATFHKFDAWAPAWEPYVEDWSNYVDTMAKNTNPTAKTKGPLVVWEVT